MADNGWQMTDGRHLPFAICHLPFGGCQMANPGFQNIRQNLVHQRKMSSQSVQGADAGGKDPGGEHAQPRKNGRRPLPGITGRLPRPPSIPGRVRAGRGRSRGLGWTNGEVDATGTPLERVWSGPLAKLVLAGLKERGDLVPGGLGVEHGVAHPGQVRRVREQRTPIFVNGLVQDRRGDPTDHPEPDPDRPHEPRVSRQR